MADRRYWALYRTLDMSQSDVKDAVNTQKFMPDTSQATVSRVIKEGDTRALCDDDFLELQPDLDRDWVDGGIRGGPYPDEWLEAYRDVLATATTHTHALEVIADEHKFTPEWAARLHPNLVGCNVRVAEYHDSPKKSIHHDDHLNHLDSVNTESWR